MIASNGFVRPGWVVTRNGQLGYLLCFGEHDIESKIIESVYFSYGSLQICYCMF